MRVLWITNVIMPDLSDLLSIEKNSSGGWICSLLDGLRAHKTIELTVACPYKVNKLQKYEINRVNYFLVPSKSNGIKYEKEVENYWKELKSDLNPQIVHIHGTEFPFGLSYIKANGGTGVVVSIQGLISAIVKYDWPMISFKDRLRNLTLGDVLRFLLYGNRNTLKKRVKYEIEYLNLAHNFIGRTEWDYAHIMANNLHANYYYCAEMLRPVFYSARKWDYEHCEPFTIMVSNGNTPIKGFHIMLQALVLVKRIFPQVRLFVVGQSYLGSMTLKRRVALSNYEKYNQKYIVKNGLEDNILFLGTLNAEEMAMQLLKSNVFVCPSSIENSSNSLKEALTLGVPIIASDVGGTASMIPKERLDSLYRFEEYELLAKKIVDVFNDKLSYKACILKHDEAGEVVSTMINIYKKTL